MDGAALDRFALLGISQGAALAIAYAVRHPERVSRLVLYGGYARGRARRDEASASSPQLLSAIRIGWGQPHSAFRRLFTTLYPPGRDAGADRVVRRAPAHLGVPGDGGADLRRRAPRSMSASWRRR